MITCLSQGQCVDCKNVNCVWYDDCTDKDYEKMRKDEFPIVKCLYSYRDYQFFMWEFCKTHIGEIAKILRRYPSEIFLNNGEHIYVMTYDTYATWCKGRTYKKFGENSIFHSGYEVKK